MQLVFPKRAAVAVSTLLLVLALAVQQVTLCWLQATPTATRLVVRRHSSAAWAPLVVLCN